MNKSQIIYNLAQYAEKWQEPQIRRLRLFNIFVSKSGKTAPLIIFEAKQSEQDSFNCA
jgi:hypothetical protein